tara:strand:- start:43 stop:669 length:627 start_codon:yes stop_codon:yes gene_type:complete
MPVTINGDGSITGLAVGGLPDGSVDADTIAANAVTTTKIANSAVTSVKTTGLGVITMAEQWRLQSALQGNRSPLTGWNVVNTGNAGKIGSSMSESSGAFTFPSTGIYLIMFVLQGYSDNHTQNLIGVIQTTTNNSSWTGVSYSQNGIYDYNNSYPSHSNGMNTHIFDVENTSTHKVRFEYGAGQGGEYCDGHGSYTKTSATFVRLGDT